MFSEFKNSSCFFHRRIFYFSLWAIGKSGSPVSILNSSCFFEFLAFSWFSLNFPLNFGLEFLNPAPSRYFSLETQTSFGFSNFVDSVFGSSRKPHVLVSDCLMFSSSKVFAVLIAKTSISVLEISSHLRLCPFFFVTSGFSSESNWLQNLLFIHFPFHFSLLL